MAIAAASHSVVSTLTLRESVADCELSRHRGRQPLEGASAGASARV